MRQFQVLDQSAVDSATGILSLIARGGSASLALRREGEYVSISASLGALEIALRPRVRDLIRALRQLQPNDGLQTTRQVGSGDCFLGLGLRSDGTLILRPTLVGDASGYFCLNLTLAPDVAATLRGWLGDEG